MGDGLCSCSVVVVVVVDVELRWFVKDLACLEKGLG